MTDSILRSTEPVNHRDSNNLCLDTIIEKEEGISLATKLTTTIQNIDISRLVSHFSLIPTQKPIDFGLTLV